MAKTARHPAGRRATRTGSRMVQLRRLAHARSGDKGNTANVGVIALEDRKSVV